MPTPQNVWNAHVHGSLLWNYLEPISKLWNHSWSMEIGDFIVHWSKNTPSVTIWVTLLITAFYEEKTKVFCITLQHLKEFYHFIAKLVNKSHSSQWELGQRFSNFGTKICKNRNGRRIWYLWEFLKMTRYWCEVLLRATIESKRLTLKFPKSKQRSKKESKMHSLFLVQPPSF